MDDQEEQCHKGCALPCIRCLSHKLVPLVSAAPLLSVCLSVCLSIYLSVRRSLCLSTHLPFCLPLDHTRFEIVILQSSMTIHLKSSHSCKPNHRKSGLRNSAEGFGISFTNAVSWAFSKPVFFVGCPNPIQRDFPMYFMYVVRWYLSVSVSPLSISTHTHP